MNRLRRILSTIRYQIRRPARWWSGLEPRERVIWRTSIALAIGFGLVWLPLVFIIPGVLWALLLFEFSFRKVT
jgi:type II secretory pathway component PulM